MYNVDFNKALDPHSILSKEKKIATNFHKKGCYPDSNYYIYLYTGSYLNRTVFSGILKTSIELISYPTFGHPTYENTMLFLKRYGYEDIPIKGKIRVKKEKINEFEYRETLVFDDNALLDQIKKILFLFREKFSFDPEFYSAFPISHLQCSGCVSNVCVDIYPILEESDQFQDWMRKLPEQDNGLIPFIVGINESLIGLIPLWERELAEFKVDIESGQGMFVLNLDNNKMREIYDTLKPLASGSLIYAVYVQAFETPLILEWIVIQSFRQSRRTAHDVLIKCKYCDLRLGLNREGIEYLQELEEKYGIRSEYEEKLTQDPYELWTLNYAIKGLYYGRKGYTGGESDPRLREALDEALEKYVDEKEKEYLINAKPKDWLDYNDPVYVKKREILKRVAVRDGEDWYRRYWETVEAVRDIVCDISPRRELSKDRVAYKIFTMSIAQAYIYLYRFFGTVSYGFPLIEAELSVLRDYLAEYGVKFKWSDVVADAVGTLVSAGKIYVVGKGYAAQYRGYGFDVKKGVYRHAPPKPMGIRRFRFLRREEDIEEKWEWNWMRYQRCLDEAKKHLDNFERFKMLHYLERAKDAYEDANRIIFDLIHRYRKYPDKYAILTEQLMLLTKQLNDLNDLITKLRKEMYKNL